MSDVKRLQKSAHHVRRGFEELVFLEPGMRTDEEGLESNTNNPSANKRLEQQLSEALQISALLENYADSQVKDKLPAEDASHLLQLKSEVRAKAIRLDNLSDEIRREIR